jgi:hypothetical protein
MRAFSANARSDIARTQGRFSGLGEYGPTLIFAVLAMAQLGQAVLSSDEARYAHAAASSWGELFAWLRSDNYPPLYFVFMKLWAGFAGLSESALRMASVPFGVMGLVVFGIWARDAFGAAAARRVWLLLALSPFFLFLARLAKYYALFGFLTLLATTLLWRLLDEPEGDEAGAVQRRRREWLWAGSSLLLLWVHYLGVVVWAAMATQLLARWWKTGSRRARRLLMLLALAFVGFVPWLPVLGARLLSMGDGSEALQLSDVILWRRWTVQIGYSVVAFSVGHTLEMSRLGLVALGAGVASLAVLAGAVRAARGRRSRASGQCDAASAAISPADGAMGAAGRDVSVEEAEARSIRAARFCLYYLLFMGAGSFLMIWIFLRGLPDLSVSERVGFLLPYAAMLAAWSVERRPWWLRAAAGALYVVPVAYSLLLMYKSTENNLWDYRVPWREIAREVQTAPERPRAVIFDSRHFGALGWYYLKPHAERFYEVRAEDEAGGLATLPGRVADCGAVFYVRATRDTSPGGQVAALEEALTARLGMPCVSIRMVFDRPAFQRIKEWFRRGSGVETFTNKLTIRRYCPGGRRPSPAESPAFSSQNGTRMIGETVWNPC